MIRQIVFWKKKEGKGKNAEYRMNIEYRIMKFES